MTLIRSAAVTRHRIIETHSSLFERGAKTTFGLPVRQASRISCTPSPWIVVVMRSPGFSQTCFSFG